MISGLFFAIFYTLANRSFQIPSNPIQEMATILKNCNFPYTSNLNRDNCYLKVLETGVTGLKRGRGNIPALDPVHIRDLSVLELDDNVRIKLSLKNIILEGFSDFTFTEVSVDYPNRRYSLEIFVPKVDWNAQYKMDGKVLLLTVAGDGEMITDISDSIGTLILTVDPRIINGKRKLTVTDSTVKLKIGKVHSLFTNLDTKGDPTLDEAIHHFINNNKDIFIPELASQVAVHLSEHFKKFFGAAMAEIPVEYIYPEN